MTSSKLYGNHTSTKEHLLRANGLAGELARLRTNVEKTAGAAVQYIEITDPGPVPVAPSGLTIVRNTTGVWQELTLPNAPDGTVKKIVNGVNGQGVNDGVYVACHNNLGDDIYILGIGEGVELTYVDELGGWVATNYIGDVNSNWD